MRDLITWGSGASQRQVQRAVEKYMLDHAPGSVATPPTATITDTATIALTLGMVEKDSPCTGAVVGGRYLAFIRSHRLNNGPTVPGRPAGYWIVAADCRAAGVITIVHQRPALAIGAKYELFTEVVAI